MRDRLIKLLTTQVECNKDGHGECEMCEFRYADKECERHVSEILADLFLAEGVIVPPVAVGGNVYTLSRGRVKAWRVHFIGMNTRGEIKFHIADEGFKNMLEVWNYDIGKTVFLSREEAETALAKRRGEDK